jgi:hypothetical protein
MNSRLEPLRQNPRESQRPLRTPYISQQLWPFCGKADTVGVKEDFPSSAIQNLSLLRTTSFESFSACHRPLRFFLQHLTEWQGGRYEYSTRAYRSRLSAGRYRNRTRSSTWMGLLSCPSRNRMSRGRNYRGLK